MIFRAGIAVQRPIAGAEAAKVYHGINRGEGGDYSLVLGENCRGIEPGRSQRNWWALQDLNLGPMDYESTALTAELRAPKSLRASGIRILTVLRGSEEKRGGYSLLFLLLGISLKSDSLAAFAFIYMQAGNREKDWTKLPKFKDMALKPVVFLSLKLVFK
jgi:hypothetical protein